MQAVGEATGADATMVTVTSKEAVKDQPGTFAIDFKADPKTVKAIESQAADSDSKLANGNLHSFLVAKDDDSSAQTSAVSSDSESSASSVSHLSEATPMN